MIDMTHEATRGGRHAARTKLMATFIASAWIAAGSLFAQDAPPSTEMTEPEWQALETRINDRASEIANSQAFFEDDRRPISVKSRIDRASHVVFIELDESFGKDVGSLELEDFMSWIRVGMEDLTALIPGFTTTEWMIGGHDMDYWFAQAIEQPMSVRYQLQASGADGTRPRIVLAVGHGVYFHAKYKWTTQRKAVNGILEA
jgi:hypothetical protein